MAEDDENKKDDEIAGDGENGAENNADAKGAKDNKPGGKNKGGKAAVVKARCIKKRQWKGRIIRPEDGRIFEFPKGIPAGFEDYFEPIQ